MNYDGYKLETPKSYDTECPELADFSDIKLEGIDYSDYPDFVDAFVTSASYKDRQATNAELEWLNEQSDLIYELVINEVL